MAPACRDCFDAVYGSSAGAMNATYFLSGQREGVDIYSQDITNTDFIDLRRLLKSKDVSANRTHLLMSKAMMHVNLSACDSTSHRESYLCMTALSLCRPCTGSIIPSGLCHGGGEATGLAGGCGFTHSSQGSCKLVNSFAGGGSYRSLLLRLTRVDACRLWHRVWTPSNQSSSLTSWTQRI